MTNSITIIPYGSLRSATGSTVSACRVPSAADGQPLAQLLETIGIAASRVQLVMVNHKAAGLDTHVRAGDRVALFPGEYPIFADWHAYRYITAQAV